MANIDQIINAKPEYCLNTEKRKIPGESWRNGLYDTF